MDEIKITREQFNKIISDAFKKGENWGVCYSMWFNPSEMDTKCKIETAQNEIFVKLYSNQY